MNIIALGINHKTAPVDIRERFYLKPIERELLLNVFKNDPSIIEAFVLSTCNRTEIYVSMLEEDSERILSYLFRLKGLPLEPPLKDYFYIHSGLGAVQHLFSVAAGLDSLIIGEKQIFGQVKEAFELSSKSGILGKTFNVLSNLVLQAGKKVRSETEIDFGGTSTSWAAVATAQQAMGSIKDKSVLIIGAGKIGKLTGSHLKDKGLEKIYLMNRTPCKAVEVAQELDAEIANFWDLRETLSKVDFCICASGAPHYIIDKILVNEAMANRPQKSLVFIDISVPRNIDPQVGAIENVKLFSIDDLDKAVANNVDRRQHAVAEVSRIIEGKVRQFYSKLDKINRFSSETLKDGLYVAD
jgi:glutamyl-tRNA reductase